MNRLLTIDQSYTAHHISEIKKKIKKGHSQASAVSTPLWWILKTRYKKLFTYLESHESAVSVRERRIVLHKSDKQNKTNIIDILTLQ